MTGGSEFNEVFLTDAKVSAVNLTGGAGDGRKVLQSALDVERRGTGETTRVGRDIDDAAESPPAHPEQGPHLGRPAARASEMRSCRRRRAWPRASVRMLR